MFPRSSYVRTAVSNYALWKCRVFEILSGVIIIHGENLEIASSLQFFVLPYWILLLLLLSLYADNTTTERGTQADTVHSLVLRGVLDIEFDIIYSQ